MTNIGSVNVYIMIFYVHASQYITWSINIRIKNMFCKLTFIKISNSFPTNLLTVLNNFRATTGLLLAGFRNKLRTLFCRHFGGYHFDAHNFILRLNMPVQFSSDWQTYVALCLIVTVSFVSILQEMPQLFFNANYSCQKSFKSIKFCSLWWLKFSVPRMRCAFIWSLID